MNKIDGNKVLLEAYSISQSYGKKRVFSQLSLSISSQKIILLKGSNGCGKTTLLKTLCGLLPLETGRIEYGIQKNPSFFQPEVSLYASLTVFENLHFFCRLYRQNISRIDSISKKLGFDSLLNNFFSELSWGQKMRVSLARTFLLEAPLYFLDEPLTGLDEAGEAIVKDLFCEIKSSGSSLFVVTHQYEKLKDLADELYTLKVQEGLFLEEGKLSC